MDENYAGRAAVDHLFLDQDAIPTLVEVKRSSDTRIRREVIGQMIDYAANAVVYCRPISSDDLAAAPQPPAATNKRPGMSSSIKGRPVGV